MTNNFPFKHETFFFLYTSDHECLFKSTVRRSTAAAEKLDHNKFADKPGQAWDAKKQCELLLLDGDARAMNAETNFDSAREQLPQWRTEVRVRFATITTTEIYL